MQVGRTEGVWVGGRATQRSARMMGAKDCIFILLLLEVSSSGNRHFRSGQVIPKRAEQLRSGWRRSVRRRPITRRPNLTGTFMCYQVRFQCFKFC